MTETHASELAIVIMDALDTHFLINSVRMNYTSDGVQMIFDHKGKSYQVDIKHEHHPIAAGQVI